MHVLGIDAGGTKTVCLLADGHGTVLGEARAGGANLQTAGELEVEKVLHHVMEAAIGDRDEQPMLIHPKPSATRLLVNSTQNAGFAWLDGGGSAAAVVVLLAVGRDEYGCLWDEAILNCQ